MTLSSKLSQVLPPWTFEHNMSDSEYAPDDERFDTALCRMAIQTLHFYKIQTLVSSGCYPRLLVTACSLIDYIHSLADRLGFIAMAPVQMGFGLLLASTGLLRILKSNVASQGLETSRARASLFTAINLAKKMSVDSADLASKTVTVLNAIWNSNKAFRKVDGSEYTVLRIRGRLVLSPILDTVWWWRDEFDPQSRSVRSVVEPAEGTVFSRSRYQAAADAGSGAGADATRDASNGNMALSGPGERNDAFHLDEQFLADFEWALGDDALFSLEPLPANLSSTNTLL